MYLHACKYILYHTFIYIQVNTYNTIPVFTYICKYILYHTCMYSCLPEDETLVLKHAKDLN